jgi:hypothetical protein
MIRMLIIGYCYGIRSERRRARTSRSIWPTGGFCRLDLNDAVPDHSSFSLRIGAGKLAGLVSGRFIDIARDLALRRIGAALRLQRARRTIVFAGPVEQRGAAMQPAGGLQDLALRQK